MNSIPVNTPLLNLKSKEYLNQCIDEGWISSEGEFVSKFESAFSTYVDRKYGIAVMNGTAALEIAVKALGLKPGDEVIIPTFCIISCAAAIVRNDLIPVLVDCDALTFNATVDRIEAKINKKTKAIMVVHTYGLPVDMDDIIALAGKHELKIIEDAAEMIGQTYKNKKCGSFGDISIVSFYPNKMVTTGEGGMILTDDPELRDKCAHYRNLCFIPERRFYHEELGWNFRMSNLQAALGLAQLEHIDEYISKKHFIGKVYSKHLEDLQEIFQLPVAQTSYANNIYWVYSLVLRDKVKSIKQIIDYLSKHKIGTRPFFWPMHEQPVFQKLGYFYNETYLNSEYIARHGFYLPSGLGITEEEIKIVCERLKKCLREL